MKTITCFLTVILLSLSFCLTAQELQPAAQQRNESRSAARTPGADRTRIFDEEKQYIVFKLWNAAKPITDKEKTELQNIKQQLTGKNVQVVEFQYKSKEDLENLFKQNGIEDVEVSTDKGIFLKCKNSNYNTTNSKAVFIFEGKSPDVPKRPIMLSTGEGSENNVKVFFKLRSFS
jgi:transcription antitermination factor NusA-like protein